MHNFLKESTLKASCKRGRRSGVDSKLVQGEECWEQKHPQWKTDVIYRINTFYEHTLTKAPTPSLPVLASNPNWAHYVTLFDKEGN